MCTCVRFAAVEGLLLLGLTVLLVLGVNRQYWSVATGLLLCVVSFAAVVCIKMCLHKDVHDD